MMSKELEYLLNTAIQKVNELKHEYLTLDTLFWAMLRDPQVSHILESFDVDIEALANEIEEYLEKEENFSILNDEQIAELSSKQFADESIRQMANANGIFYQPELTLSLQRSLQRAAVHVQSAGKQEMRGVNVLVAMFQEKESFGIYLLQKRGITRLEIVQRLTQGEDRPLTNGASSEVAAKEAKRARGALDKYAIDLTAQVEKGEIDPIIGRKGEIARIIQILCRRKKNNPLMVGEAGVGKTAVAEGLAWTIVRETPPEVLKKARIYSLDMASLIAGAKFRGDFEERLKALLKDIDKKREEGITPILFVDEIHTIMGAGATGSGSMDASNLLKPALSSGKLRLMGSTTYEEYRKTIEKDAAFNRRFQKIDIHEPTAEETIKILLGLKGHYEKHHGVSYPTSILKNIVQLSQKYLQDRKLPDKAIDVVDEVGAAVQLASRPKKRVTMADVEKVISQMAKIPAQTVNSNEKEKLKTLERDLKLLIFGQDQAIEKVAEAMIMSRSGLKNSDGPIANFLFAGPTGVGKTELARQLAYHLGIPLERFDMSEYMEKHAVARLIGAPPGYVGHDNGGLLTDTVKKRPHVVLLLDEIEKAHPDLLNILLQIMDYGQLTDTQGRNTDFSNVILIMTTNAGAKELDGGAIGLAEGTVQNYAKRDKALKNYFSPEFRNRLDAIVQFNKLADSECLKIVQKFLSQLEQSLDEQKIALEIDEKVLIWLAENGFDPKMGARPLQRFIDEKIKKPLAKELVFGHLEKGSKVFINLNGNELQLKFV